MTGSAVQSRFLTLDQVAEDLQLSRRTIERLVAAEILPSIRVGGSRRVAASELDDGIAGASLPLRPRRPPAERRRDLGTREAVEPEHALGERERAKENHESIGTTLAASARLRESPRSPCRGLGAPSHCRRATWMHSCEPSEHEAALIVYLCNGCGGRFEPRALKRGRCFACRRAYYRARGKTSARGYGGRWQWLSAAVRARDSYVCRYCGEHATAAITWCRRAKAEQTIRATS